MAVVKLLADEDGLPLQVRELFMQVEKTYGFVPNILRAMANCPELLITFVPFWAKVYESPTIGERMRALAALGTANAQNCNYCISHMTATALRSGLSREEIHAVPSTDLAATIFNERDRAVLDLAERLTNAPGSIPDEFKNTLKELFSDGELVNVVVAIGLYNLTSRFLKGLDIDLENVFCNTST